MGKNRGGGTAWKVLLQKYLGIGGLLTPRQSLLSSWQNSKAYVTSYPSSKFLLPQYEMGKGGCPFRLSKLLGLPGICLAC